MKAILGAYTIAICAMGCAQLSVPAAKVDEPEQKFITLGEHHCQEHQKLEQVLMESTEVFLGKFNENGYRRAKESEMIVIFLCKDEKIFAMKGSNFDTLRVVDVPQQPESESLPLPKNKKPEVTL